MKRFAVAWMASIGLIAAGSAQAAQQGSMGATSRAEVTITLSVAPRVRLSVAGDAPVQAAAFGQSASVTREACLWSNTATRGMRLIAIGSAAQSPSLVAGATRPGCAAAGGTSTSLTMPMPPAQLQRANLSARRPDPLVLLVVPE